MDERGLVRPSEDGSPRVRWTPLTDEFGWSRAEISIAKKTERLQLVVALSAA